MKSKIIAVLSLVAATAGVSSGNALAENSGPYQREITVGNGDITAIVSVKESGRYQDTLINNHPRDVFFIKGLANEESCLSLAVDFAFVKDPNSGSLATISCLKNGERLSAKSCRRAYGSTDVTCSPIPKL